MTLGVDDADVAVTGIRSIAGMDPLPCYLDLGDGTPLIRCRDACQALTLARLYVALHTGRPAIESPNPASNSKPQT